ncbi:winged helix-turn-helix domain-containing protein [Bosea sp. (in: a-proteobacteria)]|uniref:winged helix-turn-helix domain-containing tetratricopeptide repeat protein n=1 Tax=Bosea sp. (in: a-proteobacteria) TaxID=1871050 RepID=UPI0027354980|nr:winged helix-turn-helix domain-containing protein [Bosea sp. (in: a-proteobacteria)]MDP3406690.1 winged helix-turn-helix domain-containing protein [Bosea sp. (in: a-proteobacteria)]
MIWQFGEFRLDPNRLELTHRGVLVRAEPQVLSLLVHLVRNRDRMVGKDEIVKVVWNGRTVSDASIASRIRSARQAVGDDGSNQSVIRTLHGRGFCFVAEVVEAPASRRSTLERIDGVDPTELRRPSIAVLPFQPLGMAPDLAILADAIPHDIIQALSRLRWLAVTARGSSFRFREPDLDLIGTALSVGYVLSGIIEARDKVIAVTVQLADAGRGEVIWGDRLAVQLDGIEDLRQRIIARVVAALDLYVPENEARVAAVGSTDKLDAWANFHIGLHHLYRFTPDSTLKARESFESAVRLDPRFARAHAGLSFTSFIEAFLHMGPDVKASAQAARHHAERGLDLDPLDPFAHFTMGRSFWLTDEPEAAGGWLGRAVELNPNYAQGFYAKAFTEMLTGDVQAVGADLDTALQLSPLDPLLYGIHGVRALSLLQSGDTFAAARWADRAAATPGAHYLIAMIAALANGVAGRHQQAGRWRLEARRRKPEASTSQFFAAFPIRDNAVRSLITLELQRQGF